jgi:carboxymethylenebutenolidase
MIEFKRPDDSLVAGYLVEPNTGSQAPGIVVIQEWWGLNDQIKSVAQRFADAGYRALVPDLYRGSVALDAAEAQHLMEGLDFAGAASQDIRGAVQYLKATGSSKVGITGFCMGGALTVLASTMVPESDAAVIWYGNPPLEYVDASRIHAPLMGHFALHDEFFSIDGVAALEEKLKAHHVPFEFHRYDAKHAFANEEADQRGMPPLKYNAEAAALAWTRTLAFFSRTL